LRNATAALVAAIEIYNKPKFSYRDECFVILLLNAWELALKALISKNRKSIFYPKKRKQPYKTLTWEDALREAEPLFPKNLSAIAVRRNLELLSTYRDNAVHFYNEKDFASLIYALAQTSIVNLKDLLAEVFLVELDKEITWQLLPLGLNTPIDPIEYISGKQEEANPRNSSVKQFIAELARATREIRKAGEDTSRLLTVFKIKLESVKKIGSADVLVGVGAAGTVDGPLAVVKTLDPNVTHPLRQTEVIEQIKNLHGRNFTGHTFQAIVWKHSLKANPTFCWQAREGVLTRYSQDTITYIKRLTAADLEAALNDYRAFVRGRSGAN
jgi:hypothetical protein